MVARRALRLSADDTDALALAQEWSQRDPRPDLFAIPADAIDRMSTVIAIADLGIPVYREADLVLDRAPASLEWLTAKLVAPSGPFRYVSTAPAVSFLVAVATACNQASVPLDSIVVRVHADTVYATKKVVESFAKQMSALGLTQLRTDTVMLDRFADRFAPFDIWLDDHSEAHHRTVDDSTRAAVVLLDPTAPHWAD